MMDLLQDALAAVDGKATYSMVLDRSVTISACQLAGLPTFHLQLRRALDYPATDNRGALSHICVQLGLRGSRRRRSSGGISSVGRLRWGSLVINMMGWDETWSRAVPSLAGCFERGPVDETDVRLFGIGLARSIVRGLLNPAAIGEAAIARQLGAWSSARMILEGVRNYDPLEVQQEFRALWSLTDAHIAVVSNKEPRQVVETLADGISGLTSRRDTNKNSTLRAVPVPPRPLTAEPPKLPANCSLASVWMGCASSLDDPRDIVRHQLVSMVHGGHPTSRLVRSLRWSGIAYAPGCRLYPAGRVCYWVAQSDASRRTSHEAACRLWRIAETLAGQSAVREGELEDAKRALAGQLLRQVSDPAGLAAVMCSQGIPGSGRDRLASYLRAVWDISVDGVTALAREMFEPGHLRIATVNGQGVERAESTRAGSDG